MAAAANSSIYVNGDNEIHDNFADNGGEKRVQTCRKSHVVYIYTLTLDSVTVETHERNIINTVLGTSIMVIYMRKASRLQNLPEFYRMQSMF